MREWRRSQLLLVTLCIISAVFFLSYNHYNGIGLPAKEAVASTNSRQRQTITRKKRPVDANCNCQRRKERIRKEDSKVDRNYLFYAHHPARVTREVAFCMADKFCHVLYWHIPKTGGTYMASKLYPTMNYNEMYISKEWCCGARFMEQFFASGNTTTSNSYCQKRLGVYEVQPKEYQQVVETCSDTSFSADVTNASDSHQKHRYVRLITVREPIQRTMSLVHQTCNVHSSSLAPETKAQCKRCSYFNKNATDVDDRPFYDSLVRNTNVFYQGLWQLIHHNDTTVSTTGRSANQSRRKDETNTGTNSNIPTYLLDTTHVNEFFEGVQDWINLQIAMERARNPSPIKYKRNKFEFASGKPNREAEDKLCDFGMPSVLLKALAPSLQVYHNIWARL